MYTCYSMETGDLGSDQESLCKLCVPLDSYSVFVNLGLLIIKMGMLTLGWTYETDIFVSQKSLSIDNFIWFNLIPTSQT